ncbi:MAG: hypothetical protein QNJ38_01970 [Prochloraceae cyanobacterium]|nr:hypothetical protein [Prochloraceae cyanobacterium]
MLSEFLPFEINLDPVAIASAALWSLALYVGLSSVKDWITTQLDRWFNFADRSLYISQEEFEKSRQVRESQNAFYASVLSILPFLIVGSMCNWGVEVSLGKTWAISMAMMATISCSVYELGRRDGQY